MIAGIGAVDLALLAVLAISVVVGLLRGLLFELMALAGWVVAYLVARWSADDLAPLLPTLPLVLPLVWAGSTAQWVVAFALIFVGTMLVWTLFARLLRGLLHATPLSLPDRAGGAVFGLVRGAVVLIVVATIVAFTPAAQSGAWRASFGAAWLARTLRVVQPVLPSPVRQWLPAATRI